MSTCSRAICKIFIDVSIMTLWLDGKLPFVKSASAILYTNLRAFKCLFESFLAPMSGANDTSYIIFKKRLRRHFFEASEPV